MALTVRKNKKLDFSHTKVQNIDALIKLRNAVIHFRPEWSDQQDKHNKLSKQLKNKFQQSPFLSDEPIFPLAWASASFASWALCSTVAFLEYFYTEADIAYPLSQFKDQLTTLSGNIL